ncbi:DUF3472 domain-containing protein [Rhabdobacter roseus]|uniref:DUF5077 domain-containing protein n=1 Tax=Rhabdobacter roseus TaxID=1655419 RepID=A0A840TUA4_9BACT|nr:DUF3472 domain-containing protein [Rhabdobacter roseus]MBB5283628.1 hypothetical protein [Rhabdobacter roseus]
MPWPAEILLATVLGLRVLACDAQAPQIYSIPLGGNTWVSPAFETRVNADGLSQWDNASSLVTTYFHLEKPAKIQLALVAAVPVGSSEIELELGSVKQRIQLDQPGFSSIPVGEFNIRAGGYQKITIRGISRTGASFGNLKSIDIQLSDADNPVHFVKNNEGNFFYWGRRGPSVHLNYPFADDIDAEWFYNEITVPEGQDVIGSYYMANGFAQGYFGIQVNSDTERRVLFSVWSPFETDNPKEIPADQRIVMLKKGEDVYTGEFGNEGSGGQSFLRFNWKAGNTYRFLLRGKPNGDSTTTFTAYFFAPELDTWWLIASFKRPKTHSWLRRTHSFLENFIPATGNLSRSVLFGNQWIRDSQGTWAELTKARFTADNTARTGYRLDYAGGLQGNYFFLKNCGFFNEHTKISEMFERPTLSTPPAIPFSELP